MPDHNIEIRERAILSLPLWRPKAPVCFFSTRFITIIGDSPAGGLNRGNVGIGTNVPTEKLSVKGKIRAQEVKVETINWPDYVFADNYKPTSLKETEQFIKIHKHLPEIPSAKEVEENGISLGEMNSRLLKKIEELTLHLIEKDKEIKELKEISEKMTVLEKKLNQLLKDNK